MLTRIAAALAAPRRRPRPGRPGAPQRREPPGRGGTRRSQPGVAVRAITARAGEDTRSRPGVLGQWLLPRTDDAVPSARRRIRELAAVAAGEQVAADVELLASELLANAVQHGGGQMMHVRITGCSGVLRVEVRDDGQLREPPAVRADPMDEHGRGLLLVAALSRRWGIGNDAGGTTAWFELPAEPASGTDLA